MFRELKEIKKASKKGYAALFADMMLCGIKYNAGYMDYKIARMWELDAKQRQSVITRGISNNIVRKYNDKAAWHFFDNKVEFNELFREWVGRDFLLFDDNSTKEELAHLIKGRESLFAKPLYGSSGVGVEKIQGEQLHNVDRLYAHLKTKLPLILEETVVQHTHMQALCKESVNTVRIATLIGEKQQGIVYAFLRIGNGNVMDNVDCGGMAARVDLETGKLLTPGCNKKGDVFYKHPISGMDIVGFTIPYFEEAKQICLNAMRVVPNLRFVAWDVAITENGPVFIEGNSFPSHAVPQFAAHYPDGIGILSEFRKFIDI